MPRARIPPMSDEANPANLTKPKWPATLRAKYVRTHYAQFIDEVEAAAMANQTRPLDRNATVSLREITKATARAIMFLDVTTGQETLVAPNAVSIAQAHFEPQAWMRAIYADEVPVGFALLEDWTQVDITRLPESDRPGVDAYLHEDKPCVYLWRFMIDARYQSMGFGNGALKLLIAHAATRPGAAHMLLSFVPAEKNPEPFYQRHGFMRTGEIDGDEVVMARPLP